MGGKTKKARVMRALRTRLDCVGGVCGEEGNHMTRRKP